MTSVLRFDPVGLLTLREIRSFIRESSARGGVVFFGLLYVLGSLFLGGMVVLGDIRGGYTLSVLWGSAATGGSWNYPGLLLVAPWGVVSLPFFATFSMLVVGVGVGLGMTVAFLLGVRLLRPRLSRGGSSSAAGAVAGLTPAMISLVTLGACCSTTAAATAGVGLVAQASGTSVTTLLLNNWYLGVFQMVMVWVALVAQEMLLVVYAGLFGGVTERRSESVGLPAGRVSGRSLLGGALRVLLLGAGVVWILSVLAEWTTTSPGSAGAGLWFQWLVQHGVVGGVAIGIALFPTGLTELLLRSRTGPARAFLALMLLGGASLLLWIPPPLPSWGVDSWANQAIGLLGAPSAWGGIPPGPVTGVGLYLRWGLEYILLGGSVIACVLTPRGLVRALLGLPREAGPSVAPSADARSPAAGPVPTSSLGSGATSADAP